MITICINSTFLSTLTPFFLFGLTLIAGICTWNYQTRKKIEIDLRKETFTDILEVLDMFAPISQFNPPLNTAQVAELDKFNLLRKKTWRILLICGNANEIEQYKKFREAMNNAVSNPSQQNKDNADDTFKKLQNTFLKNIRKEIGKNELDIPI